MKWRTEEMQEDCATLRQLVREYRSLVAEKDADLDTLRDVNFKLRTENERLKGTVAFGVDRKMRSGKDSEVMSERKRDAAEKRVAELSYWVGRLQRYIARMTEHDEKVIAWWRRRSKAWKQCAKDNRTLFEGMLESASEAWEKNGLAGSRARNLEAGLRQVRPTLERVLRGQPTDPTFALAAIDAALEDQP